MIEWFRARKAAKRLQLRDRGQIQPYMENDGWRVVIHPFCYTRVRIGINGKWKAVRYCWRCEVIFLADENPDDEGDEELLKKEELDTEWNSKVTSFRIRRAI